MPLHDWSLIDDNTFHSLHVIWVVRLHDALIGLLPPGYYTAPERRVFGGLSRDVLTFGEITRVTTNGAAHEAADGGGVATLVRTVPRLRPAATADLRPPTAAQRYLGVRHESGDRLVAVIELVSAANKTSDGVQTFTAKAAELMARGVHFMMIDLNPPSRSVPDGLHNAVWRRATQGDAGSLPADKPLVFASFDAGEKTVTAYVAPAAAGEPVPDLPLFLAPGASVEVPLAATYASAFASMPRRLLGPLGDCAG